MVASMGLTAKSLFITVYIVNVFYHTPHKEVPPWFRNHVLNILAKITCYTPERKRLIKIIKQTATENGEEIQSVINTNITAKNDGELNDAKTEIK